MLSDFLRAPFEYHTVSESFCLGHEPITACHGTGGGSGSHHLPIPPRNPVIRPDPPSRSLPPSLSMMNADTQIGPETERSGDMSIKTMHADPRSKKEGRGPKNRTFPLREEREGKVIGKACLLYRRTRTNERTRTGPWIKSSNWMALRGTVVPLSLSELRLPGAQTANAHRTTITCFPVRPHCL